MTAVITRLDDTDRTCPAGVKSQSEAGSGVCSPLPGGSLGASAVRVVQVATYVAERGAAQPEAGRGQVEGRCLLCLLLVLRSSQKKRECRNEY